MERQELTFNLIDYYKEILNSFDLTKSILSSQNTLYFHLLVTSFSMHLVSRLKYACH